MGSDTGGLSRPHYLDYFNPRSRMGSDYSLVFVLSAKLVFQSTLPHGERLSAASGPSFGDISIHAPAWGATETIRIIVAAELFQSTLPHGERPSCP